MMRKLLNLFFTLLIAKMSLAQKEPFHFYSQVDAIKEVNFYTIPITPELTPYLKTDLSDIRIADKNDKWIPHIIFDEYNIARGVLRYDAEILSITNIGNSTSVIIKAPNQLLNNIELSVKNNDVKRFCSLSGSNDQKEWFAISDSILLETPIIEKGDAGILNIYFSPQNYSFLKLVIFNKASYPLNITGVHYKSMCGTETYPANLPFKNPSPVMHQKDSAKMSIVKIDLDNTYQLDLFEIKTAGIKYFSRTMDVCLPLNNSYGPPLISFSFSNNSSFQFKIPLVKTKQFYVIIYNQDNPPLTVKEINTFIHYRSLKAYLEKGEYNLLLDGTVAAPQYDLVAFKDSIPKSIPALNISAIKKINSLNNIATVKKFNEKWIIWPVLIFALIILTILAIKMTKQISNKKTNDNL